MPRTGKGGEHTMVPVFAFATVSVPLSAILLVLLQSPVMPTAVTFAPPILPSSKFAFCQPSTLETLRSPSMYTSHRPCILSLDMRLQATLAGCILFGLLAFGSQVCPMRSNGIPHPHPLSNAAMIAGLFISLDAAREGWAGKRHAIREGKSPFPISITK